MKRLIYLLIAVVATACFFLCLYGIDWIWMVKRPAISTTTYAFDQASDWLSIADKAMEDANHNLELARLQMLNVQNTLGNDMGLEKPNFFQLMIAKTVVKQMAPNVNQAQHTVEKVTEASIVINSILGSILEVPLETEKLDTEQVRSLQRQVVSVTDASWDLGNMLSDVSTLDGETPAAKSARIAATLTQILAVSKDFQQRISSLRKRIMQIRTETLYWMNLTPTLTTVGLGWVAFSQLVVIFAVVKWFQRHG